MSASTSAKRKRRADGELEDLEDLERRSKPDDHYYKGIYEALPEHFNIPWPTVRTETFVEMVFGSVQKLGRPTHGAIQTDTGLDEDKVGIALADLMMRKRKVGSELVDMGRNGTRVYFVK